MRSESTIPPPLLLPGYSRSNYIEFLHIGVIAIGDGGKVVDLADPSNTMALVAITFSIPIMLNHASDAGRRWGRVWIGSRWIHHIATDGIYWWALNCYALSFDRFESISAPDKLDLDILSKQQVAGAIAQIAM